MRKPLNIPHYYCRTDTFKNSFFPNVINEWNKLDEKIKGATSFSLFKASLLKMGCPHANSTYRIHYPVGIRLLTRLCRGLSHLNTNFDIILLIVWTGYAPAILIQRLHFIFFCTATTSVVCFRQTWRSFFTCNFLIYKKDTQTLPWSHFILKNNYIYNRVKKVYLQIWKYSHDPCSH